MARAGDLIAVYMLEPQAPGSYFDRHRWPLHITLLPWFSVPQDQHRRLERELTILAQSTPPVSVTVGDKAQFGPNKDIPVNSIADGGKLQSLHDSLLNLTKLLQLPLANGAFTGPQFAAHISRYEDRFANQGDRLNVADFYLVQLLQDNTCQILGKFDLKGSNG